LESGEKVSAGTWNTYRRDICTLWDFCEKHEWAKALTAKNTERAKGNGAAPVILLPEEAAALLTESKDDELLAYHAIAVFAGLRPSEIKKLQWGKHVDLVAGFIRLDAAITKTAQRRLVPILPNLRAWLEPVAKPFGTMVVTSRIDDRAKVARERAGISGPEHYASQLCVLPAGRHAERCTGCGRGWSQCHHSPYALSRVGCAK
jgi:integrase